MEKESREQLVFRDKSNQRLGQQYQSMKDVDDEVDEDIFDVNVFEIMDPPVMLAELYSQKVDYQTKNEGIAGYLDKNNDAKQVQQQFRANVDTNRQ